jgi:hypothetical protein
MLPDVMVGYVTVELVSAMPYGIPLMVVPNAGLTVRLLVETQTFVPMADCVPQVFVWKKEVPEQTVETSGDQAPPALVPVADWVVHPFDWVNETPEQIVEVAGDQAPGTQAGGLTVTVTDLLVVPAPLVHAKVNVSVAEGEMVLAPLVGTLPVHVPLDELAVHEVALLEEYVSVVEFPWVIVAGEAVMDAVGATAQDFVPTADWVPQELVWKNEVPEQTVETSGDHAPPEFVPVDALVVPQSLV